MCDAGRLNYKWIGRADRLKEVLGPGGRKMEWGEAIPELSARLRSAAAGSVAFVVSARQTLEEMYLLRVLARKAGALTDSIPRLGEADKLLVHADKNPNSNGARVMGLCGAEMGQNLGRIAEGIAGGTIRMLWVFGEDVTKHGIGPELLAKLEVLVVSDILPNETTRRAHYLLPGCAHAEKRGTFINARGRVQRFWKAVEPPGQARPEIEWLGEVAHNVAGESSFSSVEALFNHLTREAPVLGGIRWDQLGDTGIEIKL
jgi:NADH-quinone oxidoreductase subunit G